MLLWRLLKGFRVALALDVQLAVLEPNELEDRDLARLSELTFFVLLVAVLLQSAETNNNITFLLPAACLTPQDQQVNRRGLLRSQGPVSCWF